ncbi:MAG: hypothetical protein BGO74_00145 [Burkholderiales bacterium 68-12]|nr:MAG: hypothetical protein BGO74_00145 [Burkholderiales bacterium 68-12]
MQGVKQLALAAILSLGVSAPVSAQSKSASPQQLELFGVKLKGATRDQLREALKAGGMRPIRVDDNYWADTYNPEAVLEGASSFAAGYVYKTKVFAYAEYEFRGFMDTGLVTKVANMVSNKYGRPGSQSGNEGLGPVTYKWNLPQDMSIRVARGWPDTTTYLTFTDQTSYAEMKAEQDADKQAEEKSKAKAQTKAF